MQRRSPTSFSQILFCCNVKAKQVKNRRPSSCTVICYDYFVNFANKQRNSISLGLFPPWMSCETCAVAGSPRAEPGWASPHFFQALHQWLLATSTTIGTLVTCGGWGWAQAQAKLDWEWAGLAAQGWLPCRCPCLPSCPFALPPSSNSPW